MVAAHRAKIGDVGVDSPASREPPPRSQPHPPGLDRRRSFIRLRTRTAKALPSIVTIPRSGLSELKIRAEQRPPQLVAERAVPTRQLLDERISRNERIARDVECIEPMMSKTCNLHEKPPRPDRGRVETASTSARCSWGTHGAFGC